jgi:hypothetical protein
LQELTFEALDTVLELINQNSLYRGKEWESRIASFRNLKTRFEASENKDNFCWENLKDAQGAATLRNTSMGTLLVELSAGEELDKAVRSFERMVAPSNYQRPTALVTKSMVEAAKKKILELGYEESLARRHAVMEDLNIQNLLFVDRSSDILSSDVFSELAKSAPVNPKSFSKLEEISIEDFIEKVLPKTKSLKVFTENEHISNFVSLIAPDNKNAKSLFKWANGFSWSYTGGITDSIKQRVKSAGGNVDGIIRVSLSWYNYDDLDLHVFEPQGNHIYYGSKHNHATTGVLDVDMNAGGGHTRNAVENITWSKMSSMQSGVYKVQVKNYNRRESFDTGFEVEIEHNGVVYRASSKNSPSDSSTVDVFTFRYNNKSDTFEILTSLSKDEGKVVSKDVWNVKTNVFTKVKSVMLSPNHWEKNSGNKHYFFILDSCVSPENPRGFFNEFLNDELSKDKKVFEALGNKLTVPNSDKQVSGLGFSETQRNSLVVEVDGTFKRQLKIKF